MAAGLRRGAVPPHTVAARGERICRTPKPAARALQHAEEGFSPPSGGSELPEWPEATLGNLTANHRIGFVFDETSIQLDGQGFDGRQGSAARALIGRLGLDRKPQAGSFL